MSRNHEDWIEAYMQWQAGSESPTSYKKWMAIGAVSACLQRKCSVPWENGWLHPNMYIILVGPSGEARKGTAMSPTQRLLKDLNVGLSSNQATMQAIILDMKDAATTYHPKGGVPVPHCSLCLFSKELTVMLSYNDKDMFANLCDWYDCDPSWVKRTVSRDVEEIVGMCVSLIGATTPASLQSCLPEDAIGGGFTSRVIYVFERKGSKRVSPWRSDITKPSEADYKKLLGDLRSIKQLGGQFELTADAVDFFTEWYERGDGSEAKIKDKRFSGYNSRRATHVAKLSMVMCASRTDSMVIEGVDVARAVSELNEVERNMPYVFQGIGMNPYAQITIDILEFCEAYCKENQTRNIKPKALMDRFCNDVDMKTLSLIMSDLEAMQKVRIVSGTTKEHFEWLGEIR